MNEELLALVERAKARPITPEELRRQRTAFAYGNLPADSSATREVVNRAAEQLEGRAS